jgi:hypothetical protein
MRTLPGLGHEAIGIDILESGYTHHVGSIADREFVRTCMKDIDAVLMPQHCTSPCRNSHTAGIRRRQHYRDLNLLEGSVAAAWAFSSTQARQALLAPR